MLRHITNRIALCLLITCIIFLAIGIIIEIALYELIFEEYLSTFIGYSLIFGFIYAKTKKVNNKNPNIDHG